ncbi:MAG TPA: hypothetical protein VHD91_11885 [Gaiellaceae bacterium]|nr:hypothetical protein [Gaiellaceae bacterium]
MRERRISLAAIALPVVAYLTLQSLVASLYVHPPLLGWIGFSVVGSIGTAVASGAVALFPRMRTSVDAPRERVRGRLLVLADADCPAERVCHAVASHLGPAGASSDVLVVAPVLASPLHYLTGEEESETAAAEARLAAVLAGLRLRGLAADGRVGGDDPLQALGDALAAFPAAEALLITANDHWLEPGLVEQARRLVPELELVHAA